MMKKIKLYIISILSAMSLAAPFAVTTSTHALFEGSKDQACAGANLDDTGCSETQGVTQVDSTISTVINLLSFLVGVVSVIMIIIGGIRFVTSQGNAQNATSARNTVLFAVIGLALAAFAQLIVKFVLAKATT